MKEYLESLGKDGLKAAYSALSAFALILTVIIAICLIVAFVIIKFKAKDKLDGYKKTALGIVVGYSITLISCISFFMIARLKIKDEINGSFYFALGFAAVILCYAVAVFITSLTNKKAFKICNAVGLTVCGIYGILFLSLLPTYAEEYAPLSKAGMYIFSLLLIAVIAFLTYFFGREKNPENNLNEKVLADEQSEKEDYEKTEISNTKTLAFAGVSIALSFALSYIKLFSLPQGGSITLASMLPLIIYAYAFGVRRGVMAGVIYGMLQLVQSPQIYEPMQVVLDYPVAFGAIGLAGIVKNMDFLKKPVYKFLFGSTVACLLRYVSHFLSGYYVFSSWAMEGYTALTWSLVYNLYVLVDLIIIIAVGIGLFLSKGFNKELNKITR